MSSSAMAPPSPPPPPPAPAPAPAPAVAGNPSSKKRKFDELDQPLQQLPPTGSTLYVALYALPPSKQGGGLLNYDWAFVLAPDDNPDTHGRRYLMREINLRPPHPGDCGDGSERRSEELGMMVGQQGLGLGELGREQQQRRSIRRLPVTQPQQQAGYVEHTQRTSAWELQIQDVRMWSDGWAGIRVQLSRVQDVEMFEALVKDVYLESDETKGLEWNRVGWMADAWSALLEIGDVLDLQRVAINSQLVGWQTVRETAVWFFEAMEEEGRFGEGNSTVRVPTWGLLEQELLVP